METPNQDLSLQSRIIDAARQLFHDHGYSKVSTNEIAEAVGISKKTLYREFETKEEILRAAALPKLKETAKLIDAILDDQSMPFLDKLKAVMSTIGFQHQKVSHILMRDVYVHAPDVWREINLFRQERFRKFGQLLNEGIEKGVFRSDISPEIILRGYMATVDALMTPATLCELPFTAQEVFQNLVTVLFEGILRDDSRAKFGIDNVLSKSALSSKSTDAQ